MDRDERARGHHLVAVLEQLEAQLLRLDAVGVGVDGVEVTEVLEQLGRCLLADTRDARHVVGRVALEGLEVDHLAGREPVALEDGGRLVRDRLLDAAAGGHDVRQVGHQLEHVQVAGHDRGGHRPRLRLERQRADEVVGLESLEFVDGDAEGVDQLADPRELLAQVVGHRPPSGLVLLVLLVAERRPGQVEAGDHVVRMHVLVAPQDDAPEAEDGVDQLPLLVVRGVLKRAK